MSYYSTYRWCAVPVCKNTSVKTPDKLWIQVPTDKTVRKTWFKLARRDLDLLFAKTRLYFCEDHFDLEHDMENYIRYKIMGSVKRIRLKPNCVPSKFDWNRKHKSTSNESHLAEAKTQKICITKDSIQDHVEEDNIQASYCIEDSQTALDVASMESKCDEAVHIIQVQDPVAKGVCKGEVTRLERVCCACWKSANRTMQRQQPLDADQLEDSDTQDLSQEQMEQDVFAETCADAGHSGRWDEVKVFAESCADAGHSGLWDEVKVENTDVFDDEDNAVDDSDTLSVDSNVFAETCADAGQSGPWDEVKVENTDMFHDEDNAVDDSNTLVDSNVCRVCLTLDVKMYDLKDIELKEMFQNVTGIVVTENNHSILERLCWECVGRLKAAAGFRNKALHSDALLQGLASTGEQIRKNNITSIKENADYLKSAGTLSVAEVLSTVEIEPQNDSVPPISENNDTDIVENIVKNEPIELEESVFEDGYYQVDVKDEFIIEDLIKTEIDHDYICHNTEDTNPVAVHSIPFREDTINSAYNSPQVDPKKLTPGYVLKTSSDCEDIINKPVTKTTNRDAISKIVSRKSNQVIRHHTLIGDAKLKNINVKVGGICKKTSNLKLVKKSQVMASTDKECMNLEKI